MKQPFLPKPIINVVGPDGKPLVGTTQNIQTSTKEQKLVDVPASPGEYIGGKSIPYKKAPGK